ncbi:MAG: indolepyruvate ferredoxin oxidoreductase subunit alpha [Lentisphaeria bacterium]|nr:indolepyruvate ferredoxin oxidoreductase subunit alpha [Lentisphaeria bacterium]
MAELLSGNEAIARGAYQAGVTVATGYPGTPSTEILEALVRHRDEVYCEWSPNEKVALEVAVGASLAGARCLVTMKHVGLNVAADPLLNLSSIGVEGGLVICVADDPGRHSSQNEQDTRWYARLAKVPVFEPANSQEAIDFMAVAIEISERYRTPVILRTTTRVSHSRSLVELSPRRVSERPIAFEKNPSRHCPLPLWGGVMRENLENRLRDLGAEGSTLPVNRIEWADRKLGIITESIAYEYVKDVWPEASVLKLGMPFPFPDALLREFAAGVERVLVVEELEPVLEERVRVLGIPCVGKEVVPIIGELSPTVLAASRAKLEGREIQRDTAKLNVELPGRPPVLCPGCPHRGLFHALTKHDVVVTGDIGCYSLAVFKPLDRTDVILCMGAGVSMAHGFDKAGLDKKIVGVVGDSTFFHSGITGLLDISYNRGCSTIVVVDNRTTAMTGHQDHPGTGRTLMGETTIEADIADIARACGFRRVRIVNPYDLAATQAAVNEELGTDEPSLIVSRAPCPLHQRKPVGKQRRLDDDKCRSCRVCLKLGCPAIEYEGGKPRINSLLCAGCGMCEQVCRFGAIQAEADHE